MKSAPLIFLLIVLVSGLGQAGQAGPAGSRLKTEHDFNDTLVNGKFQAPLGATVSVDDDKLLDDLVGVRKNFIDRISEAGQRE